MYPNAQDVPAYSGRQSRRRPQLSESEDGEPVTGRDLGKVARQDTFSRNTFPARGKQRSLRAPDTSRSVSVPPKPFSSLPSDTTREPAYWGLAHPLSQVVLVKQFLTILSRLSVLEIVHIAVTGRPLPNRVFPRLATDADERAGSTSRHAWLPSHPLF